MDRSRAPRRSSIWGAVVVGAWIAAACGVPAQGTGAPSGSGVSPEAPPVASAVDPSAAPELDEATGTLVAALQEAGAGVRVIGPFEGEPVGGQGVALCVDGNQVNVYVFADAAEAASRAAMIDPKDPSNLGTSIVSWVGNPRFWQADRLLVLYLGDDPVVETGLRAALGAPFAEGQGRGPAGDLAAC